MLASRKVHGEFLQVIIVTLGNDGSDFVIVRDQNRLAGRAVAPAKHVASVHLAQVLHLVHDLLFYHQLLLDGLVLDSAGRVCWVLKIHNEIVPVWLVYLQRHAQTLDELIVRANLKL